MSTQEAKAAPPFAPGDSVVLKCGGIKMVVTRLTEAGNVVCQWQGTDGSPKMENFPPSALQSPDLDPVYQLRQEELALKRLEIQVRAQEYEVMKSQGRARAAGIQAGRRFPAVKS